MSESFWRGNERAISEVLGYALVFAMIVSAIAIVSLSGFAALENTRNAEQVNNAERAFDILADNMADIYLRGAPSRATEMSLGNAQLLTADNVTVTVEYASQTVSHDIRPLVYRANDGTELVYTGGTVFRDQRNGGLVLRDPPIVNDGDRVLVSIVRVQSEGTQGVGSSNALVRAVAQSRSVPIADSTTTDSVVITVESERPELWQTALEQRGFDPSDCSNPVPSEVRCVEPVVDNGYVTVTNVSVNLGQ
jgi:hypothetical protein